jgi:hypothetical protein
MSPQKIEFSPEISKKFGLPRRNTMKRSRQFSETGIFRLLMVSHQTEYLKLPVHTSEGIDELDEAQENHASGTSTQFTCSRIK